MDKMRAKTQKDTVSLNAEAHNERAEKYDDLHVDIFNPTEQARIADVIKWALGSIATGFNPKKVLDFGAGTGNLTMHLWHLGAQVVAADVSDKSLKRIQKKLGDAARLSTLVLNGKDLSNFADNSFDMVATYSVLHHLPDYLKIVEEFVRVTKPGGIIVIDHEVCPAYWRYDKLYQRYLKELGGNFSRDHLYELGIINIFPVSNKILYIAAAFLSYLIYKISGKKTASLTQDGDIHVFKRDHIEWNQIERILSSSCDFLSQTDYLVCREWDEKAAGWNKWKAICSDMHCIIVRKKHV